MSKLDQEILRAKKREEQAEKDITILSLIIKDIDEIISPNSSLGSQAIILKLKKISEQILYQLDMRRGAAAMRHNEIPWKQLSFLERALDALESADATNSTNFLQQAIDILIQSKELNKIKDLLCSIVEEEKKQKSQASLIVKIYEFQKSKLSDIQNNMDNIKIVKDQYQKILSFVESIIGQETEIRLEQDLEKRKENLKNFLSYLENDKTKQHLPPYLLKVIKEIEFICSKKNFDINTIADDLKPARAKLEKIKTRLVSDINSLKTKKYDIEEGKIFNIRNPANIFISSSIELNKIINELESAKKLTFEQREKSILTPINNIRNSLFEAFIVFTYQFNGLDSTTQELISNHIKKLIDLLAIENFLDSDDAQVKLKIQHIVNEINAACKDFKNEYNRAILNSISESAMTHLNIFNRLFPTESSSQNSKQKKQKKQKKSTTNKEKSPQQLLSESSERIKTQANKLIDDDTTQIINERCSELSSLHTLEGSKDIHYNIYIIMTLSSYRSYQLLMINDLLNILKSQNFSLDEFYKFHSNIDELLHKINQHFPESLILSFVKGYLDNLILPQNAQIEEKNKLHKELIAKVIKQKEVIENQEKSLEANALEDAVKSFRQDEILEDITCREIDIPILKAIIDMQFDRANLRLTKKMINEFLATLKSSTSSNNNIDKANMRLFIAMLLVIGESLKDLSPRSRALFNELPIQLLNKLRNVIYHDCIDMPNGRRKLINFIEQANKKHDQLITEIIKELNILLQHTENCLLMCSEYKLKDYIDYKKVDKQKIPPLEKKVCEIANRKTPRKIDTKNYDNLAKLLDHLLSSEINETENVDIPTEFDFNTLLFPNALEDIQIINDFINELYQLKTIIDTEPNKLLQSSGFSMCYCGELSRLLKDNSTFFSYNAHTHLLNELEFLIVERGKIAHRSAIKDTTINQATSNKLVNYTRNLMSITLNLLQVLKYDVDNINKLGAKWQKTLNKILEISTYKRRYQELEVIKSSPQDIRLFKIETLLKLFKSHQFLGQKDNLNLLTEIKNELTECKHFKENANKLLVILMAEKQKLTEFIDSIEKDNDYQATLEVYKAAISQIDKNITYIEKFINDIPSESMLQNYETTISEVSTSVSNFKDEDYSFLKDFSSSGVIELVESLTTLELFEGPARFDDKSSGGINLAVFERKIDKNINLIKEANSLLLNASFGDLQEVLNKYKCEDDFIKNFNENIKTYQEEYINLDKQRNLIKNELDKLNEMKSKLESNKKNNNIFITKFFKENNKRITNANNKIQSIEAKLSEIDKKLVDLNNIIKQLEQIIKQLTIKLQAQAEPKDPKSDSDNNRPAPPILSTLSSQVDKEANTEIPALGTVREKQAEQKPTKGYVHSSKQAFFKAHNNTAPFFNPPSRERESISLEDQNLKDNNINMPEKTSTNLPKLSIIKDNS